MEEYFRIVFIVCQKFLSSELGHCSGTHSGTSVPLLLQMSSLTPCLAMLFLFPFTNSLCLYKGGWNTSRLSWAIVSFPKSSGFITRTALIQTRLKTFQFQNSHLMLITKDLALLNTEMVHLLSLILRPDSDQIIIKMLLI